MTDDSSWHAGPRRSAEARDLSRYRRAAEPPSPRGRRSAPDDAWDAPRRGARRSADYEPWSSHRRIQTLDDETQSSPHSHHAWYSARGINEGGPTPSPPNPAPPHISQPAPPDPQPEPVSNIWAAAAARNREAADRDVQEGLTDPTDSSVKNRAAVPATATALEAPPATPKPLTDARENKRAAWSQLTGSGEPRQRRRKLFLVLLCLLAAVLLIGGVWVVLNRDRLPLGLAGASSPTAPGETPTTKTTPEEAVSSASLDPESTEGARAAVEELVLNDTQLTAPGGWNIYGDGQIEDALGETDRRVVRLSHGETDVRLQVVSVTSAGGDLGAACEGLSTSQQEHFSEVTPSATVPVGVDPAQGAGYSCGFHGVRTSDGVASTVTFTLLLRVSDGHVLMLRSIVPDSVGAGAVARQELAAMNCTTSLNFGVTLPLC